MSSLWRVAVAVVFLTSAMSAVSQSPDAEFSVANDAVVGWHTTRAGACSSYALVRQNSDTSNGQCCRGGNCLSVDEGWISAGPHAYTGKVILVGGYLQCQTYSTDKCGYNDGWAYDGFKFRDPPVKITLSARVCTAAGVAGPPARFVAKVMAGSEPLVNKSVNIGMDVSGHTEFISGPTASQGNLNFFYRAPKHATTASDVRITASCDGCGPQAESAACIIPPPQTCGLGNPIHTATGAKTQSELDYAESGSHGVEWRRTYSSLARNMPGQMGGQWTHNFGVQARLSDTIVNAASGQRRQFLQVQWPQSGRTLVARREHVDAAWVVDGEFVGSILSLYPNLVDSGHQWLDLRAAGSDDVWRFAVQFSNATGAQTESIGVPVSVVSRSGHTTTMAYQTATVVMGTSTHQVRQLREVSNAFGRRSVPRRCSARLHLLRRPWCAAFADRHHG